MVVKEIETHFYANMNDNCITNSDMANDNIRKEMVKETLLLCDEISVKLGNHFDVSLNDLVQLISKDLFHIETIPKELAKSLKYTYVEESKKIYSSKAKTFHDLINRFVPTLVNFLIAMRRDANLRKKAIEENLENLKYMSYDQQEIENIIYFSATGKKEKSKGISNNSVEIKADQKNEKYEIWLKDLQKSNNGAEVAKEITDDIAEFTNIMGKLVFNCSGILVVFHQEIDHFKNKFIDLQNIWKSKVRFLK